MKKIYMTIGAFLLCASMAMAQAPANRTAKTIAADVLAQMPAQEQQAYEDLIGQLCGAGDGAVQTLIGMINAPGKGSNAQVDYALSGLSHYVMSAGKEQARLTVSNAYCQALERVTERETKAFLIRQLEIMGGDEAVETLAGFLGDESLSGPAARALSSIGTKQAGAALVSSLKRRMGTPKTQRDAINAIGEMPPAQVEGAEPLLLTFVAEGTEPGLRMAALYALGHVGSEASLETLADAAEAAHFTMEPSGANEAYIQLLKKLAADGRTETVAKAAKNLQKQAAKAGALQSREAALEILLSLSESKEATKLLLSALKDKDRNYRNAALDYASAFADEAAYIEIAKAMMKSKPDVKVDILNWLGREAKDKQKHPVLKGLMIRFDLPFASVLRDELNTEDFAVRQAAVWTMVKLGDKGFIPTLANLLTDDDKQTVLLAQDALLAFPGNIDDEVAKAIGRASGDAGKIAGIELLACRMADSKVNTILAQRENPSPAVRAAVYKALQDVVTARDFVEMCGILESEPEGEVPHMQEAVIASVRSMPEAEQVETVVRRMYQAGEAKKHLYYPVLASTGQQRALDLIQEGCEGTGASREAAVQALLAWPDMRAADFLYDMAQAGGADAEKSLQRYVELVSAAEMTNENKLLRLRKAMDIATTDAVRNLVLQEVQQTGTFLALLYAGEFLESAPVQQAAAQAVMNIALAHPAYTGQNVRALLERTAEVLNNPDASYQREAIKKHLAEMPDEVGFVPLFNGKDLSGWKGLVENPILRAKMKPAQLAQAQKRADEQMHKDWQVEDGCIVYEGTGFNNLCTDKQYGDFELYVEWMLDPAGPDADAGIYLRGTPQVQIWDTARVNVGAQVGSGGLYNNQQNPSKPSQVADNKLGEWNTFFIRMVGDRVTVDLNGVRVVDNVILENYWDRAQPIFPTEQIELQAHGSRCSFRNLYIKELPRKEPFQLSDEEKRAGFQVLFDGTNMHAWCGNTGDYILEDGCISMVPSRSFGGNLYTKAEFADFVYRFEFQLTPGANNGVGLRAPLEGDAAYVGMESQILDCEHPIYSNITPLQHHGSIYGILPANEKHTEAMKPVGEWNYEEIVCKGDYVKVTLNGVVIVEGNLREATQHGTPDGQEHPGLFNRKGHIGFLGHGSPIKFRNIRILELK